MAAPSTRHIEALLPEATVAATVIPTVNQAPLVPTGPSFPGDHPGRD